MVYIGDKLGKSKIYEYLKKYGFGELTGIDLQGENTAYLKTKENWYPIDYSTVTFGQGIALTPIQMIRSFASIINGGKLMKPYLVDTIVNNDRQTKIKPKLDKKVVSEQTSAIIRKKIGRASCRERV